MIYKTLHRKLKIEQQKPCKNIGYLMCSGRVGSSCDLIEEFLLTIVFSVIHF
jgi:hypothetical protein